MAQERIGIVFSAADEFTATAARVKASAGEVEDAFKTLGVESSHNMMQMILAYKTLENSGRATSEELKKAHDKLTRALEGGVTPAISSAAAATMSWTEFLKGRMGPAMREFGNHTDAVRHLSEEFKKYKATGVASHAAVSEAGATAAAGSRRLSLEMEKVGDISEYAGAGLRRVRSIIEGFAFGAAIGAVSALTDAFVKHYMETSTTKETMDELTGSISAQAAKWKLLPKEMKEVSAASVELYNSTLDLVQFNSRDRGAEIQRELEGLKKGIDMREEALRREVAHPAGTQDKIISAIIETHRREVLEAKKRVAELSVEYKGWINLRNLTHTSVSKVTDALGMENLKKWQKGYTAAFDDFYTKMKVKRRGMAESQDPSQVWLTVPDYDAMAADAIARERNTIDAVLSARTEYLAQFASAEISLPWLVTDEQRALMEETRLAQDDFENQMLDSHLARLDSRYQAERDNFAARIGLTDESFSSLDGIAEMAAFKEQARLNIREKAYQAMGDQMLSLVETGKFSVGAFAQVVAQQVKMELTGLAARATIWAIYETAMGLRDLAALSPGTAALHFTSAAEFGAVAGGALIAAAGVQAAFGGHAERPAAGTVGGDPLRTAPAESVPLPTRLEETEVKPTQEITIQIYTLTGQIDGKAQEEIIRAINEAGDRNVKINAHAIASN